MTTRQTYDYTDEMKGIFNAAAADQPGDVMAWDENARPRTQYNETALQRIKALWVTYGVSMGFDSKTRRLLPSGTQFTAIAV